jgi:hypothetical protein
MESKNEFYLLAMVGIVAIVAIVVLITGTNNAPRATYTSEISDEDAAGFAMLSCSACLDFCGDRGGFADPCWNYCTRNGYCAHGSNTC